MSPVRTEEKDSKLNLGASIDLENASLITFRPQNSSSRCLHRDPVHDFINSIVLPSLPIRALHAIWPHSYLLVMLGLVADI